MDCFSLRDIPVLLYSVEDAQNIDHLYKKAVKTFGNLCGLVKLVCQDPTDEITFDHELLKNANLYMKKTSFSNVRDESLQKIVGLYSQKMKLKETKTSLDDYKK